mgnify:CR=1 FL=1
MKTRNDIYSGLVILNVAFAKRAKTCTHSPPMLLFYQWLKYRWKALAFLAFKLIKSEKFQVADIILIMLNSFIFYGFGIAWLYDYEGGEFYLGLFTLFNALIHFAIKQWSQHNCTWSAEFGPCNLIDKLGSPKEKLHIWFRAWWNPNLKKPTSPTTKILFSRLPQNSMSIKY